MNAFRYIICVFIMSHSPTHVMGFLKKNKYGSTYNLQFITLYYDDIFRLKGASHILHRMKKIYFSSVWHSRYVYVYNPLEHTYPFWGKLSFIIIKLFNIAENGVFSFKATQCTTKLFHKT